MTARRVVVADDDPGARAALLRALEQAPGITITGAFADGMSALEGIRALRPDIAFLDIEMPGPDGLEIAARLDAPAPAIVFVTAHDRHAIEAFELHVVDYVLKPFEPRRIVEAAERAIHRAATAGEVERLRALVDTLRSGTRPVHAGRFVVREDDRFRFLPVERVDWIEADRNYVVLHSGADTFRIRGNLGAVHEALDPRRFVRIHRSRIVNVDRVAEVQPWFNGDCIAILEDGRQLRVSRTFRDDLLRPIA